MLKEESTFSLAEYLSYLRWVGLARLEPPYQIPLEFTWCLACVDHDLIGFWMRERGDMA